VKTLRIVTGIGLVALPFVVLTGLLFSQGGGFTAVAFVWGTVIIIVGTLTLGLYLINPD